MSNERWVSFAMHDGVAHARIAGGLALLMLYACNVAGANITGRVVTVHTGDTLTVLDARNTQHKIRLTGIYAPQLRQAFGAESKQNLSGMVYRKQVTVEWDKRGRDGRILGKVLYRPDLCVTPACLDRTDANYQQIAVGLAWHYDKQNERDQSREDRERYAAAEKNARAAKRGLWADPAPVPPWEWRRVKAKK